MKLLGATLLLAASGCYPSDLRTRCDPTQPPGFMDSCGPGGWLYPPDAGPPPMFDAGADLPLPPLPAKPPRTVIWCIR